ncbi:hypothetical protein DRN63_02715 [Nanoarchaeota archaeon]|nr:MAG: hypothetical protein DRN63_02715 [Nanoarchaeota archaeon]
MAETAVLELLFERSYMRKLILGEVLVEDLAIAGKPPALNFKYLPASVAAGSELSSAFPAGTSPKTSNPYF